MCSRTVPPDLEPTELDMTQKTFKKMQQEGQASHAISRKRFLFKPAQTNKIFLGGIQARCYQNVLSREEIFETIIGL